MSKFRLAAITGALAMAVPGFAQYPTYYPYSSQAQYPTYYPAPVQAAPYPDQLARLVQPIALYPDPLLAQVLSASTYWDQIPAAAAWANQYSYLTGDALANAIYASNLPWDPSVVALIPFPSVLDMMAQDPGWTQALGNAVLTDRGAVLAAVQEMRQEALSYGYLQNTAQNRIVAAGPGAIEILPMESSYICVPVYNPAVVFGGYGVGVTVGAISCARPVFVGGPFVQWGWAGSGFAWPSRTIIIDRRPWERTYANRYTYVHPYEQPVPRYRPAEQYRPPEQYRAQQHGRPGTGHYQQPPAQYRGRPEAGRSQGGRPEGGHPEGRQPQGGHPQGGHSEGGHGH